jgi:hypothetical protein
VDDHDRLVGIYLRDHLAGSVAALELVERAARSNETNALGEFLTSLHEEIRADQETLLGVMKTLGVGPSRVKNGLAWTVEKAGRLKLNGRLTGYSPLSRLIELEGLITGINGKLSLWRSLMEIAPEEPRLDPDRLGRLLERGQEQLRTLEGLRDRAAREALLS